MRAEEARNANGLLARKHTIALGSGTHARANDKKRNIQEGGAQANPKKENHLHAEERATFFARARSLDVHTGSARVNGARSNGMF